MRIVLAALIFTFSSVSLKAQQASTGYQITVTTDYKDVQIYLGDYYGKRKLLADSAKANSKGVAVFKGDKKLPEGIYFIVSPDHVILFEILMDYDQHFSLVSDSTKPGIIKFTGSPDNDVFAAYSTFLAKISPQLSSLQQQLKAAKNAEDSASTGKELSKTASELTDYRNNIITKSPNSMLTALLQIAKIPDRPQIPVVNGKADSLYPFYYVKNHYWDNVDFTNDIILHTPFFDPKLEDYFKYYVSPNPDSIISEVNYMLLSSRDTKELHDYLLGNFTDKYINPEFMGQDKVFLFLFENFYSKGDTTWLNEKQRKYIFDRAYSLMANQLNEQASPLDLTDTLGNAVSLYNIKAPLTFVAFWDPHCSHCQAQIPRLDSFYQAKWKNQGVKVMAVCVNDFVVDDWKKFIVEHKLNGWYHAYETKEKKTEIEASKQADYRQLYDISQTPTYFLLDENKRIIAKGLSLDQYDELIDAKLKTTSASQ
ncbi:MAG: redoxin domain-containing protein [Parafilimonas sp.]